jgi:hypothetical protein
VDDRVVTALKSLAYDLEDSGVNVTMLNLDEMLVFANVKDDEKDRVKRTGRILAERHGLEFGLATAEAAHGVDMTMWFEPLRADLDEP